MSALSRFRGSNGRHEQELDGEDRPAVPASQLARRRDRVAKDYATEHWDLGGLAYEMAVRDHFRLDVLKRQAAKVQELDSELSSLERLLRLEEGGAAGACPTCNALYNRGAVFCWQCGRDLAGTTGPEPAETTGPEPAESTGP